MAKKNDTGVAGDEQTQDIATRGPSPAMLALFSPAGSLATIKKSDRLNFPVMLKPADFPLDAVLQGEIVKIVDSPVTTIKGKLLWLKLAGDKEITFPCTGVVRSALAPGIDADDKKGLQAALDKHIGKVLTLKRSLDGRSKKYDRNVFMFDVFLSDKAGK